MLGLVSIVRCEDYNSVESAIHKALAYFGGIETFVKPNDLVLLKPNLLTASPPETAIVTNPAIVAAVAKMVVAAGGQPIIADSPGAGIPYTTNALKRVYQVTGYDKINEKNILNFDTGWSFVANPQGQLIKRLEVINPVINCSKIINLPKFKTHTFTIFSGAIKNMFGIVPGFVKPSYHARLRDVYNFSEMLIDILTRFKPTLNIMDGIIGLEGDGPGASGTVRKLNLILASPDAIALDTVCCEIVGIPIETVPTLWVALRRKLLSSVTPTFKIFGGDLVNFKIPDFQKPKTYDPRGFGLRPALQKLITPVMKNLFSLKPIVLKSKCQGCGDCVRSCPTKAIKIKNQLATINYSNCIRCYCCVEACPQAAITTDFSLSSKLLSQTGLIGLFQKH